MTYVELEKLSFKHPIVLYDGHCFLCDRTIQYLIKKDKEEKLRYHTLNATRETLLSVKLLHQGKEYDQSDVMVMASKIITNSGLLLSLLKWFPKGIRDLGYRIIARNRYALFGRSDTCILPNKDIRHLFLDTIDGNGK